MEFPRKKSQKINRFHELAFKIVYNENWKIKVFMILNFDYITNFRAVEIILLKFGRLKVIRIRDYCKVCHQEQFEQRYLKL